MGKHLDIGLSNDFLKLIIKINAMEQIKLKKLLHTAKETNMKRQHGTGLYLKRVCVI